MERWTRRSLLVLLTAVAAASSAGCGSGGGASVRGALAMTVDWPARSAGLLPQGTESICVTIEDGAGTPLMDPRVIKRNPGTGSQTVVFSGLAPGTILVEVTAHGRPDGTDPPLAAGTASGTIEEGKTATIAVSLNSTVAFVTLSPAQFGLSRGKTQQLTASAFDAEKRLLLGATFAWSSSDPSVANVDPKSGLVTPVGPGQVTIFAREESSGIVAQVNTFVE
jgi:uncharacterized protein YjdB